MKVSPRRGRISACAIVITTWAFRVALYFRQMYKAVLRHLLTGDSNRFCLRQPRSRVRSSALAAIDLNSSKGTRGLGSELVKMPEVRLSGKADFSGEISFVTNTCNKGTPDLYLHTDKLRLVALTLISTKMKTRDAASPFGVERLAFRRTRARRKRRRLSMSISVERAFSLVPTARGRHGKTRAAFNRIQANGMQSVESDSASRSKLSLPVAPVSSDIPTAGTGILASTAVVPANPLFPAPMSRPPPRPYGKPLLATFRTGLHPDEDSRSRRRRSA